jgi:hypothetical protein
VLSSQIATKVHICETLFEDTSTGSNRVLWCAISEYLASDAWEEEVLGSWCWDQMNFWWSVFSKVGDMVVCGEFWWVSLSTRLVELKLTWLNSILYATISNLTYGRLIGNNEQDTCGTATILIFGRLIRNNVQSLCRWSSETMIRNNTNS